MLGAGGDRLVRVGQRSERPLREWSVGPVAATTRTFQETDLVVGATVAEIEFMTHEAVAAVVIDVVVHVEAHAGVVVLRLDVDVEAETLELGAERQVAAVGHLVDLGDDR